MKFGGKGFSKSQSSAREKTHPKVCHSTAYLDQRAVAVGRYMWVEVEVVVNRSEARDNRFQAPRVFLDQLHDGHQALRCLSLRPLVPTREKGGVLFTHAVQGRKHRLGVHHYHQLRQVPEKAGEGGLGMGEKKCICINAWMKKQKMNQKEVDHVSHKHTDRSRPLTGRGGGYQDVDSVSSRRSLGTTQYFFPHEIILQSLELNSSREKGQ